MSDEEKGKTPTLEGVMPDSQPMEAERGVQPWFSKAAPLAILLLPLCVLLFAWLLALTPDREEIRPRTASIAFEAIALDEAAFAPLELAGAWRLSSDDEAFGGISALAVEPGGLLALSDAGVLVSFAKPAGEGSSPAYIRGLPDGPGTARFKRHRDSEALLADPGRRGWWVAFENHDQLWLFDERFRQPLRRIGFGSRRWPHNSGIEAIAAARQDLLAIPEGGETILRISGSRAVETALPARLGWISDAATLPDDGLLLLLLERTMTWRGFANALVPVEREGGRYRLGRRIRLPLGALDNAEALAVEPLDGGAQRLWVMTDDNFQPPLRTLLVALDIPAEGLGDPGR